MNDIFERRNDSYAKFNPFSFSSHEYSAQINFVTSAWTLVAVESFFSARMLASIPFGCEWQMRAFCKD